LILSYFNDKSRLSKIRLKIVKDIYKNSLNDDIILNRQFFVKEWKDLLNLKPAKFIGGSECITMVF